MLNRFVLGMIALSITVSSCRSADEHRDGTVVINQSTFAQDSTHEGQYFADFTLPVEAAGRYAVQMQFGTGEFSEIWIEDYRENKDDRTYNITGNLAVTESQSNVGVEGSPLDVGNHLMRIYTTGKPTSDVEVSFKLMVPHKASPMIHVQEMSGTSWELVWSDEFNSTGMPDTSKWTYDVGNWGWGNNELQYYTVDDSANAYVTDGTLKIRGNRDEEGNWTSARMTTRGKHAFIYGRIEFRAKVPVNRGTWAAGWLLGNDYVDELSWPYCGEIDVLECVGFEIDDSTGSGLNHATCHTRAYYFKQGNQIGSEIAVDSMNTQFHTYAVEWDESEIRGYLDGEHYYTYDKNANELEWPFNDPQNIIINLAIGGGWGGAKGMSDFDMAVYELDYVRVYERTGTEEQ